MSTLENSRVELGEQFLAGFPVEPPIKALWAPIFMEPIAQSGERWTIGVAVAPKGGQAMVVSALQPQAMRCVFGRQAAEFLSVANLVLEDLRHYSRKTKDVLGWQPPLSGVRLGVLRPAAGDDLADIARQGLSRSACLSALMAASDDEVLEDKETEDRWPAQVYQAVSRKAPQLSDHFNKKIQLREGSRKTEFDYYSEQAAIGLCNLRPWSLANDVRWSKSKLLNLEQLRARQGLFPSKQHELLIHRPDPDDATYSARQIRLVTEALCEIEDFATECTIRLEVVLDAGRARDRIIELEADAA